MHTTAEARTVAQRSEPSVRQRIRNLFRPQPGPRYLHPKAVGMVNDEADHDANLDVAEDSAPNYLQWIADRCGPHLGRTVLEVGAGTGSITERYAPGRQVLAIDRSEWCVSEMQRRFDGIANVRIRQADLLELLDEGQRFDSVVMLNVLEHIEDDVAALQSLRVLLENEGRVVLYVPALNGLYGKWDRKVGHCRRYAPWRLREVLAAAGLLEVEMRYMNALSIAPWWAFSHSDVERSTAGSMALWDKTGIRLGRRLESIVRPPIGLNLFCVARPLG